MTASAYPVRVSASLDSRLSRGLWLVKWVLLIPHIIILAFLWVAFVVLSMVAFFAILFTGRYPRSIFDFNVGVLRWTWRVSYYSYGALATDRYPPFTLNEVPDYPAHVEIEHPQHLSRGLVLIKWWLLAIPHYLVIGVFVGGGLYAVSSTTPADHPWLLGGGLIGLLVLFAGVVLLFTGRYPRPIFDFVLGLNRWVLRVAAYAGLMTDEYPPFRLDMGGDEPQPGQFAVSPPTGPTASTATQSRPWTAGRVVLLVLGSVVFLVSLGIGAGGTALAVADKGLRDDQGFFMSGTDTLTSNGYAITSESLKVRSGDVGFFIPERLIGKAKLSVASGGNQAIFVGIARSTDVQRYLGDVNRSVLVDYRSTGGHGTPHYRLHAGGAPSTPPGRTDIWIASKVVSAKQSLVWPVESGDWTAVVMNADGSRIVHAEASAGATFPTLGWIAVIMLAVATALLLASVALMYGALRSHSRSTNSHEKGDLQ
jgi:hypothetical protein